MPKAMWNEVLIAEAPDDAVKIVEGNVYFPMASLHQEYLRPSETVTKCPWKGSANYYSLDVNGKVNTDAAWVYRVPLKAAEEIAGHVAFWRGVDVIR